MKKTSQSSRKHTSKGYSSSSNSSSSKKKKPLKIDCTSLLNHLKLIQKSIPHLRGHHHANTTTRPNIQMLNFQSAIPKVKSTNIQSDEKKEAVSSKREKVSPPLELQDWYILVASTPYAISAQLVAIPTTTDKTTDGGVGGGVLPDIIVPDLIHCTPISVWTCNESSLDHDDTNSGIESTSTGMETASAKDEMSNPLSSSSSLPFTKQTTNRISLETLTCNPQIVIQEPTSFEFDSDYLQVAIVCGTDQNRVLSIQLSIISYIGMQGSEGRFVLTKAQRGEGIVEPLILDDASDKSGMVKRKNRMASSSLSVTVSEQQLTTHLNHSMGIGMTMQLSDQNGEEGTTATTTTSSSSLSHLHPPISGMDGSDNIVEWVPFCPRGGVQSISSVYGGGGGGDVSSTSLTPTKRQKEFVWITYGDGTFVRVPKWAFFGDWGQNEGDLTSDDDLNRGLEDVVRCSNQDNDFTIFKGRLDLVEKISGSNEEFSSHVVIPLPKVFPTLLSQPNKYESKELMHHETLFPSTGVATLEHENREQGGGDEDAPKLPLSKNPRDIEYEFFEAVCYRKDASSSDSYPSLAFYTNENQFHSTTHKAVKAKDEVSTVQNLIKSGTTLLGGTATLAKSVFGGMMGVLGRSMYVVREDESNSMMEDINVGESENEMRDSRDLKRKARAALFPALNHHSSIMKLGSALYDNPRQIIHVAIDPLDGNLMACSDNLGRVQLIDLESKQPIRMWKGFREATCHWIQFPYSIDGKMRTVKYLAIHSKQRSVVEIYRMAYGPRVGKFDVKSDGVSLVQCPVNLAGGERYERTFELRISKSSSKSSILKEVTIFDDELIKASREGSKSINAKYTGSGLSLAQKRAQEGTIQMQLLKQLLATESAVPSDLYGLYEALTQITAISDLSKALDLLATAVNIQNMGIVDSSFHSEVVLHAREQLDGAMEDPAVATSKNSHIEELSIKIDLHTQLILAYDEIHEFENSEHMNTSLETIDGLSENKWVKEAIAWRETFEKVTSTSMDRDIPDQNEKILSFATFAKGCLQDGQSSFKRNKTGNLIIYLCDSTRDRKQILLHMFGPLTKDVFSSKSTYQAFEHLGLSGDFDTLLKYYGEWFMSLPKTQLEKQCNGVLCPIVRWLHDMVLDYMESEEFTSKKDDDKLFFLETLHKFCCEATDLPRAFLLASVCRDAIFFATNNIEDKTYGLITCEDCVKPWETLLRKIRVCLCMTLRLNGLHVGPLPITVSNVECGEVFSIYQLIAHDELSMTYKNDDIIEMELFCVENPDSFYPSTADGDEPNNWKLLQLSCIQNGTIPEEENVDTPSLLRAPLLLVCFLHFFEPVKLASHRTLILAQKWGENPHSLHLLENALSSLRSVRDLKYLSAVCQEVWNNNIRPIYRAFLFGFHEAHELCEVTFSPLLNDVCWMKTVNKVTLEVIGLLRSTVDVTATEEITDLKNEDSEVWPPLQKDIILDHILRRCGALDDSSLETHSAVICALQLADDLSSLPLCFPTIDDLFLRESTMIHQPLTLQPNEAQSSFLNNALRRKAFLFDGNSLNYDDLDDITTLARAWGMDKSHVLTEFLIVMYEQGKDDCVQHLITSTRLIEIERFQDGCMSIACVRLDAALTMLKRAKKCRNILSMLDADTCEWVKEQSEIVKKQRPGFIATHIEDGKLISLENTQDLILRIKRMSSASRIDATALSTMCDVLLKASDVFE